MGMGGACASSLLNPPRPASRAEQSKLCESSTCSEAHTTSVRAIAYHAGSLDEVAIPLVEERLSVDKREVETGRVRVGTVEDERVVQVDEILAHSVADIERVPVGREIEAPPPIRQEGDTVGAIGVLSVIVRLQY